MNTLGIYVRVSRKGDREDDRFHSPKEQAERAAALAIAKGYTPGPLFEDIDVSGATPPAERPAMSTLLEKVKAGELAGVAAFSLDRLSREPAHGDELVRTVTKAGGVVITPDIPDAIDSPTGEFTFGMLLQVAKLYRSQAGARFASAKERAIKAGIPVGTVPVGYRQRKDRTLEPDPATAAAVRELFERRARHEGYTPLAAALEAATGRTWTRQGVAAVLANRLYATGRLEYAGVVSDVAAEPLVDEPLWHAAQSTQTRRPSVSDGAWLLTGLARCASCGHRLTPWYGTARRRRDPRRGKLDWVEQTRPRRYRCRNRACAARASVDAPHLEELAKLECFVMGHELEGREQEADLTGLREEAERAERRLSQVLTSEARDALGDLWAADVKARRAERDEALARLGEAREAAGIVKERQAWRLDDVWDDLSPDDRRTAVALFWKEIRVHPAGNGHTNITFVRRGSGAEAALETELARR